MKILSAWAFIGYVWRFRHFRLKHAYLDEGDLDHVTQNAFWIVQFWDEELKNSSDFDVRCKRDES